MKKDNNKDDSVIVKIVGVAGALAALALILIFLLRGGLFSGLVADINNNTAGFEGATIYDVCYYNAFNVVYVIVYAVALFSTILAPIALLLRYNGAALLAKCACIFDIVLGLIVIVAKMFGSNALFHKVAAKLYLAETGVVDTFGDFMGVLPVVCAAFVLVLAVVALVFVQRGKLHKIKLYNNEGPREIVRMIIPVLYGVIFMETIRPVIITAVCDKVGGIPSLVNSFILDYYFSGKGAWGFNVPYVWFVIIMAVAVVVANRYLKKYKSKVLPCVLGGTALFYVVRSAIFMLNPPRLFGYLTLDDAVCDATEVAYPIYMILLVTDVLLLMLIAHWCTKKELAKRTLLIILGCHCVISLLAAFAASAGVVLVYGICLGSNALALIGCFYMAYVRGRHH